MKLRLLLVLGILLWLGFLSVHIVQAPWTFTTTEYQGQYTINVGEYQSWGANHTADEKWNITCQVVGDGLIHFYIFSQNHYDTYVSQFGFAFASEMFEYVQTVTCEHDFTSTTRWWIVVENAHSQAVTIDLHVDLYAWQEPITTTGIPGYPWGSTLIGLIVAILLITIIRQHKSKPDSNH